jgi:ATP:ADP antiporter, AAA family
LLITVYDEGNGVSDNAWGRGRASLWHSIPAPPRSYAQARFVLESFSIVHREPRAALRGAIARLVGVEVRRHERRLVALLTLDVFCLLSAYYVLKIVREPLVLLEGGVVGRNAARGVQAAILLLIVPLYGRLASRYDPRRLVNRVYGAFLICLLSFPILSAVHVPIGGAFFVWLGTFSITTLAQFWSLANDLFDEEDGKRLFPIIAAGGTLGGVVGAQLVVQLQRWLPAMQLVYVAAGLLALCIVLTHAVVDAAARRPELTHARPAPLDRRGGFRLLLSDRYLLLIGIGVVLLNVANSTGDQVLALLVDARACQLPDRAARGRLFMTFYASFQTWISVLTALLQIFVVGRVLQRVRITPALLVLPILVACGYGLVGVLPLLGLARAFKIVENSTDYSMQNTLQQVLFLPTTRDAKYKAKAAIDTFLVRLGDLGSWALVFIGLRHGWGGATLSIANVVVACVWILVAIAIGHEHERLSTVEPPNGPLPAPPLRGAPRRPAERCDQS